MLDDIISDHLLNDGLPRDAYLSIKLHTREYWPALKDAFPGLTDCGCAAMVALWSERIGENRDVAYSRSAEHYDLRAKRRRDDDTLYTLAKVRRAADDLDHFGLLEHHFRQDPGRRSRQSVMRGNDLLVRTVTGILGPRPKLVPRRPKCPVEVRDADRTPMALRDTDQFRRLCAKMDRINEGIVSVDVSGGATSCLTSIYHGSYAAGGRHYASGMSWQNASRESRLRLTINGESVVEWDYKNNHAHMLYADAGAVMPTDAYVIGNWPRELTKLAFLTLVNAKSMRDAIGSIAHKPAMAMIDVDPGSDQAKSAARHLIEAIKERHAPIEKAFHSAAGGRLMKRDAAMAEDVMLRLQKQGVVVLPIYDAFLAPSSKGTVLQETMIAVANDHGVPAMGVEMKVAYG